MAHRELCRVMRFKKLCIDEALFDKHDPISHLFVIISGKAAVYATGRPAGALRRSSSEDKKGRLGGTALMGAVDKVGDAAQGGVRFTPHENSGSSKSKNWGALKGHVRAKAHTILWRICLIGRLCRLYG